MKISGRLKRNKISETVLYNIGGVVVRLVKIRIKNRISVCWGCVTGAIVADWQPDVKLAVSSWISQHRNVKIVTHEYVRKNFNSECAHAKNGQLALL